jgi:hypothetical protein
LPVFPRSTAERALELAVELGRTEQTPIGAISAIEEVDAAAVERVVTASSLDVVVSRVAEEEVLGGIPDQCVGQDRSLRMLDRRDGVPAEPLDKSLPGPP